MSNTHKKLYFHKYKKPQRSSFALDPISSGVRASIIQRVDNIYNHIQQLHNKSSFIKSFVSIKTSISNNKIIPSTQRLSQTVNNFRKTSFSCSSRKQIKSMTKTQQSHNYIKRNSQFNNICERSNWRKPMSQSHIRQMLKKRTKLQKQQTDNIMNNPYYKIMKRRVKTSVDQKSNINITQPPYLIQKQRQRQELKVKTQNINTLVSEEQSNILNSQYSASYDKKHGEMQGQSRGIRQKSQTKIYEQIKKYFQEKYGAYRNKQNN